VQGLEGRVVHVRRRDVGCEDILCESRTEMWNVEDEMDTTWDG